jgi:hypothetical protein
VTMQRCEGDAESAESNDIVRRMALISVARKIPCANDRSHVGLRSARLDALNLLCIASA